MALKKVYVLMGSEDGLLGVYRLKKDAISAARKYCQQSCEGRTALDVDVDKYVSTVSGPGVSAQVYFEYLT